MTPINQWTGRESRLLREALRLSVRRFADYLGVPVRTISKWEHFGSARVPRPDFQAMLDTALAQATPDQRTRFEEAAGMTTPQASPPVSLAAPLMPRFALADLQTITRLTAESLELTEPEMPAYFERQLSGCQDSDGSAGPGVALPMTLGLVAAIETGARRVSLPARRRLLCLASRASEFIGWLYRDAGALDDATYWYDRATEYAQEAGHLPLQGYILLRRSQLAYDQRDGLRVRTLAQATTFGAWDLPARVLAEVLQQEALGLAMTGYATGAVERRLDEARTELDRAPAEDDISAVLGTTFTAATLDLRSAACFTEAGRPEVAVELIGSVLAAGGLSRRDGAYFQARQAAALAAHVAPDAAADLAVESAMTAAAVGSQRTWRVLEDLVVTLQPWSGHAAVRSFREVLRV